MRGHFSTEMIIGLCFGGLLLVGKKNMEKYGFAIGRDTMIEEIYIDEIGDLTGVRFNFIIRRAGDKIPPDYDEVLVTGPSDEQCVYAIKSSKMNGFIKGFNTMCAKLPSTFCDNDVVLHAKYEHE